MRINYRKANRELLKVKQYIEHDIVPVLYKKRNLKLYDVLYQFDDIIKKYLLVKKTYNSDDLFQWFCEDQYMIFTEDMQENGIDINKLLCYIGRTSSFYINPNKSYDISDYTNMECLYDAVVGGYLTFSGDKIIPFVDEIVDYKCILDSDYADLEYIISGRFYRDVKSYFSDCLKVAEYIDKFMENQVSIFTDFVEFQNELLMDQEKQEKEMQEKEKTDFIVNTASLIFV